MEIINILKEEVKYDRTVNHDQRTYSECAKKPTVIHSHCDNFKTWKSVEISKQPKLSETNKNWNFNWRSQTSETNVAYGLQYTQSTAKNKLK
jgi:hypothetical protein